MGLVARISALAQAIGDGYKTVVAQANRTALQLVPKNRFIAILGDSITAQNSDPAVGTENYGYLSQALRLADQRFVFRVSDNFGKGGDTSFDCRARVAAVIASGAGTCILAAGTNDRTNSPAMSAADTIANLTWIRDQLVAAGIFVIMMTPTPRGDSAFPDKTLTGTAYGDHLFVRRWILTQGANYGCAVVDLWTTLADPASTTAGIRLGYTRDGLHPLPLGAYFWGKPLAAVMCQVVDRDQSLLPAANSDVYDAVNNPYGHATTNPLFQGTAGVPSTGGSGQLGDGWNGTNAGTASAVTRVYAKVNTPTGDWQQITVGGGAPTATSAVDLARQIGLQNNVVVGGVYEGVGEYEIDAGSVNFLSLQLGVVATGPNGTVTLWDSDRYNDTGTLTAEAQAGTFRTPRLTIPSGVTDVRLRLTAYMGSVGAPAAVVRVRKLAMIQARDTVPTGRRESFAAEVKALFAGLSALQLIAPTKVDKVAGKGLSTNDYTTTEQTKLAGIQTGAQVNVATNLTSTVTATNVTINSSTGAAVAIAAASSSLAGVMTNAQFTKLAGIAAAATANSTDAVLLARANHTGTQAISTVVNLQTTLDGKVDKVSGYGLSETSFSAAEKAKLAGLDPNHYRGTFTSLASLQSGVTSPVAGDYADVDSGAGSDVQRYIYDVNDSKWVAQAGTPTALTAAQVKTLYESNADTYAFNGTYKNRLDGLTTTNGLTEGSSNLYFTTARVLATQLAGLNVTNPSILSITDSVIGGLGKLQAQISAAYMSFASDAFGFAASTALNSGHMGRWISVAGFGLTMTLPDLATIVRGGQTIRLINRGSDPVTVSSFSAGQQIAVGVNVSATTFTLQMGEYVEFTANLGGTALWYTTARGQIDGQPSVGCTTLGGQNLFYNSAMRKSATNGQTDGWAIEAPGSPGASTGSIVNVPSFMSQDEQAQRLTVAGLNQSTLYRTLVNTNGMRPWVGEGLTVTASVYFKGTAGLTLRIFIQALNAAGNVVGTANNPALFAMTGGIQRYSLTYPNLPAGTVRVQAFFRVYSGTVTDGTVDFARPQMEVGTLSGWSEDTQIKLDGLATELAANTSWDVINVPGEFYIPVATGTNAVIAGGSWFITVLKNGTTIKQIAKQRGTAVRAERLCDSGVWGAWDFAYSRGNILGGVSQTAGAPTGAIIERGTNANGSYVKFADGTMHCWSYPANTATLALNATGSVAVTWPVAFVDTNYYAELMTAPFSSGDHYGCIGYGGASKTVSGLNFQVRNGNTVAQGFINQVAFASGRWF